MKVLAVVGTRPEGIKMAPVIGALEALGSRGEGPEIDVRVVTTAQHRGLLDEVLELFEIVPHHDLDLMTRGQTPSSVAARVLERLEPVLAAEAPDWVLVQGDTTTAAAAALAAFYGGFPVAHVEAGLRTRDLSRPFPEEANRQIVARLARRHYAPTPAAADNLRAEGVPTEAIRVTGNPVIDAFLEVSRAEPVPGVAGAELLPPVPPGARRVVLTAHRRESFGPGLEGIARAVTELSERYGEGLEILCPLHPNPRVAEAFEDAFRQARSVRLVPPLPYGAFVAALSSCHLVLTDSGGIQEEAPSLGKPVLVLRETTERPEAVAAGTVRLVGTDPERIVSAFRQVWEDEACHRAMARAVNPYGDGRAAQRIAADLTGLPYEPFAPRPSSSP